MKKPGKVFLIGAGPGDPGLLTCKAKALLSSCDVVCYDKLVSPAILASIPSHVQMHEVGYRGYNHHISYDMHPDVLEFSLQGKSVARLKAGDPCIFGRTTEECRDLIRHNIEYEIVPGITAALGAASYTGFPLTSGKIASSVTFQSGHKHSKVMQSWSEMGKAGGTLVLYMGAKKLAEHAARIIENGRSKETPVAFICAATSADHHAIIGTLGNIAEKVAAFNSDLPALVIIGDVVKQADELDWRKHLTLAGVRLLVCGEYQDIDSLKAQGAEPIVVSELAFESHIDARMLAQMAEQNGLEFADMAAWKGWVEAVRKYRFDIRRFTMPFNSALNSVVAAMAEQGVMAEALPADKAVLYTSSALAGCDDGQSGAIKVGTRHCKPLPFHLPKVQWLLVEDCEIVASMLAHHSDALTDCQVIALNRRAEEWATAHGFSAISIEQFNALFAVHDVDSDVA